jgi:hypothetical protein
LTDSLMQRFVVTRIHDLRIPTSRIPMTLHIGFSIFVKHTKLEHLKMENNDSFSGITYDKVPDNVEWN